MTRQFKGWNSVPRFIAVSLAALTLGVVGCAEPGYYVVAGPPPPLRAEGVVASPGVGYVWTPGYWNWSPGGYFWVGGAWRFPPHRGAIWIGPHREWRGNGWVYYRGYWR